MNKLTSADDYIKNVCDILETQIVNESIRVVNSVSSIKEAAPKKRKIVLQQKQLRQVKREINNDMKAIRANYRNKSNAVRPSGSVSFVGLLFGRKSFAKDDVARQKREIKSSQASMLAPYDEAKFVIDKLITQLDSAKLQIQDYVTSEE